MSSVWRTILVPTDFSPCADAALTLAVKLAGIHGASIVLLHASELPGGIGPGTLLHPEGRAEAVTVEGLLREAAEEQLVAQARRCAGSVPVTVRAALGRPAEVVLRIAAAVGADCVVMGTHGRTGLAHALLGSVAERIVRTSPIPVLTVRRPEGGTHGARTSAEQDVEDESAG